MVPVYVEDGEVGFQQANGDGRHFERFVGFG